MTQRGERTKLVFQKTEKAWSLEKPHFTIGQNFFLNLNSNLFQSKSTISLSLFSSI